MTSIGATAAGSQTLTHDVGTQSTMVRDRNNPLRNTRIVVANYGGPDQLRIIEEDLPQPKEGEARVRVLAAGVSLPDLSTSACHKRSSCRCRPAWIPQKR